MTANGDILAAGFLPEDAMGGLEQHYTVHHYYRADDPGTLLDKVKSRVSWMVGTSHAAMPASLIDSLPALQGVSVYGVGYEKVDIEALASRNLVLTNTPDVMVHDVADLGMALILATVRRMAAADRFVRQGRCARESMPFAHTLNGMTLGVAGLGRIGREVARRAETFGMQVAWYGPAAKPEVAWPYYSDLRALAEAADVLILTLPGSPETRHLVNDKILEALGPEGSLINIARGMIVDEPALVKALEEGRLGAAGLDVFEDLAHPAPGLFALDNVVLSPHRGSATFESRAAMARLFLANVDAFFNRRPFPSRVAL